MATKCLGRFMPGELEEELLPCRHYPARFNGYNLSPDRGHPRNRCKDRENFYMLTPRLIGGAIWLRLTAFGYMFKCSHDFGVVPDYEIFLKSG